jgi:potassium voltage-gated channel Eag-related subfamily H protein 7
MALLFVCCWTPYEVTLMQDVVTKSDDWLWLTYLNYAVDSMFISDMCLQFFLMYPHRTQRGTTWIFDRKKIAVHYLKGWFLIDFASVMPFDRIGAMMMPADADSSQLRSLKIIRGIRLLKMMRVLRAGRILGRMQADYSFSYQLLQIFFLCFQVFIAGHWLACVWGFIGLLFFEGENPDPSVSWIASFDPGIGDPWEHFSLYMACLYWSIMTLTSIGYGDITPSSTFERFCCVFCMLLAAMIWAKTIGSMTAYMTTLINKQLALHSTLDELNNMMEEKQLPNQLRRTLRTYFRSVRMTDTQKYFNFLREMSPDLRRQVCNHVNEYWTENVWFFKELGDEFLAHVAIHFRPQIFAQEETFGDLHVLYICNTGLVARKGRVMRRSGVWGDDILLTCRDLCVDPKVTALTLVEVLTLEQEDFFNVQELHQYERERIALRKCTVRHAGRRGILIEAKRRLNAETEVERLAPSNMHEPPPQPAGPPVQVRELMEEVEDLRAQLDGVLNKLANAANAPATESAPVIVKPRAQFSSISGLVVNFDEPTPPAAGAAGRPEEPASPENNAEPVAAPERAE